MEIIECNGYKLLFFVNLKFLVFLGVESFMMIRSKVNTKKKKKETKKLFGFARFRC